MRNQQDKLNVEKDHADTRVDKPHRRTNRERKQELNKENWKKNQDCR